MDNPGGEDEQKGIIWLIRLPSKILSRVLAGLLMPIERLALPRALGSFERVRMRAASLNRIPSLVTCGHDTHVRHLRGA